MAGVLVIGDARGGALSESTLEAAAAAAALARALGAPLHGGLIGADLRSAAEQFRADLCVLHLVEGAAYGVYHGPTFLAAARAIIAACAAEIVLFPHTLETREWVPQLACELDAGLVMDCTAVALDGEDLVVTKPVYGGGVIAELKIRGTPRLATVRSSTFEARDGAPAAHVVPLEVAAQVDARVTLLDEATAAPASGLRLKDAKIVVAGGRGIGGPDHWHFIDEAAAALGAAVGCSRPVADAGWVSSAHQVGLSGTSVKADLYLAVGISGAVQHLAGISAASTVVAINTDANADMFGRANYGVVGDYREVLPAFVERVRQLRSG